MRGLRMRGLLAAALTAALVMSATAEAGATEHTTDPVPPPDAVAITVDAPLHEARLEEFDEVHWYRFDATEGQDYWIVVDTGGNRSLPAVDAWLSLHDAAGERVDVASASDDGELRWKLLAGAAEATYFVRVFTDWRSYVLTGRYGLAVHALEDDHGDTPVKGTAVDLARTAGPAGTIDYQDDVDWFRFSAEEGDLYRITAPDTVEMSIQLLFAIGDDPGDAAGAADGGDFTRWGTGGGQDGLAGKPWLFAVSGRYGVRIGAASDEQGEYPRHYAVDFELLTDDHSNTPQGATPLSVDQEIVASHDYRLDEDWFTVDLVEGHRYVAELSRADSHLPDLSLELFGAASDVGSSISRRDLAASAGVGTEVVWRATQTGPHIARVTDASNGPGERFPGEYSVVVRRRPPDDHADVETGATLLSEGAWTEGTLEVSGDLDWYWFSTRGGALYVLEYQLRDGETAEFVPLADHASGVDVSAYFVTDSDSDVFLAALGYLDESDGTRSLVFLSEAYDNAGGIDYRFRLVEHKRERVDHADDRAGARSLRNGETVSGAVSEGDSDWFAFDAHAGGIYSISTVSSALSHELGRITIEVLDDEALVPSINRRFERSGDLWPDAAHEFWLAPELWSGASHEFLLAPESGRYWIRVLGQSSGPETYGLSLAHAALAKDDHGDTSADATRLDPSPATALLGALGLPPAYAASAAGGKLRLATARGRLEGFEDVDWFGLNMRRGVKYRIVPAKGDPDSPSASTFNENLGFSLQDGDTRIDSLTYIDSVTYGNPTIEYVPTVTGTRFLVAEGRMPVALRGVPEGLPLDRLLGPFEYGFDVEILAPDDVPDLREAAPVVSSGDSLHGTLDTPGDVDWFRVDAREGETWILQSGRSHWGCAQIHAPGGAGVVLERCSEDRVSWTAFETGEYGIRLSSSGDASDSDWRASDSHPVPSDYSMTLRVAEPDDHGNSRAEASVLQSGEERSGRIDYAGDRDVFKVNVETGDIWRIEITRSGTGIAYTDQFIARDDVAGTASLSQGFDGPSPTGPFDVVVPADGLLLVAFGGDNAQGQYSIVAERLDIGDDFGNARSEAHVLEGPTLSGGACDDRTGAEACEDVTTVTGRLDYPEDVDYFRVPLEAGRKYEFRLEGQRAAFFALLDGLWCALGGPMAGWGWTHRVWAPSWTGDYWVRVGRLGRAAGQPESYALSITARGDDYPTTEEAIEDAATQLEPGQVHGGTIASSGTRDRYRVSLDDAARYVIEVNGTNVKAYGVTESDALTRTWVNERSRWLLEVPSHAPTVYLFEVLSPRLRPYTVVVREFAPADESLAWEQLYISPAPPPYWCEPDDER